MNFLRKTTEDFYSHNARNLAIGVVSAVFLALTERPLVKILTRRSGGPSSKLETILGFLFLDYTLYLWHRLNHRSNFLWNFHRVHHSDQDLTLSTGIRFHVGELFFSLFWRAGQILIFGVKLETLRLWQTITLIEILFHHSNLRLPLPLERILQKFIVTPRMHGIHHSIRKEETNSNYSSILTVWDWLHGTLSPKLDDPELQIGLPGEVPKSLNLKEFFLSPIFNLIDTQGFQNHSYSQRPSLSEHSHGQGYHSDPEASGPYA